MVMVTVTVMDMGVGWTGAVDFDFYVVRGGRRSEMEGGELAMEAFTCLQSRVASGFSMQQQQHGVWDNEWLFHSISKYGIQTDAFPSQPLSPVCPGSQSHAQTGKPL